LRRDIRRRVDAQSSMSSKNPRLNGSVKSFSELLLPRARMVCRRLGNIHHSMDFEAARFEMPLQ